MTNFKAAEHVITLTRLHTIQKVPDQVTCRIIRFLKSSLETVSPAITALELPWVGSFYTITAFITNEIPFGATQLNFSSLDKSRPAIGFIDTESDDRA